PTPLGGDRRGRRIRQAAVPLQGRDRRHHPARGVGPAARPAVLHHCALPPRDRANGPQGTRAVPLAAPLLEKPPPPRAAGPALPGSVAREDPMAPLDDRGETRADRAPQRHGYRGTPQGGWPEIVERHRKALRGTVRFWILARSTGPDSSERRLWAAH